MDPRDSAGIALAGAGGTLAGGALADSAVMNRILARILSNRSSKARSLLARALGGGGIDYRVPVTAASDYMQQHGSGEAAWVLAWPDCCAATG